MAIATPVTVVKKDPPELVRPEVVVRPKPLPVDTKYEPRRHLLQYISGARWIVNYYKQIITKDDAAESFNVNRPTPYQQYDKIENFEIRVTSPLQNSPNNEEASQAVSGVGIIYPSIVPAYGDIFLADIGDGQTGMFSIREVTQKSRLRDTAYEIEYDLVNVVTHELLQKLEDAVVVRHYYERSYADYGANPKLDIEQHGLFKRITTWQDKITKHYFDSFYSQEYDTFLVPMPGMVVYDPFIVEFIQKLWSVDDLDKMRYLRVYDRDTSKNKFLRTIWDVIANTDNYMLATVKKKFGVIPRKLFNINYGSVMSFATGRLDYIYHPVEVRDEYLGKMTLHSIGDIVFPNYYSDFAIPRKFTLAMRKLPGMGFVHPDFLETPEAPDAKKLSTYNTYVLSPAFYDKDYKNMSKVERILTDTLDEKPTDAKSLLPILEDCINWGEVERFYYIPLLYALSRSALGDLSQ